jgi:hypothetical protein
MRDDFLAGYWLIASLLLCADKVMMLLVVVDAVLGRLEEMEVMVHEGSQPSVSVDTAFVRVFPGM